MPVYSLLCDSCGKTFDVVEPIREHEAHLNKHDLPCPSCGSTHVVSQLGVVAVRTSKKS